MSSSSSKRCPKSSKKRKRGNWNTKSSPPSKKNKQNHNQNHPNNNLDSSSNHNKKIKNNLWSTSQSCLSWLVSSNTTKDESHDFITNYWSKKPYLLKRNNTNYYKAKGIDIDLDTIYKIIKLNEGKFTFGQNVICKYYDKNTKKEITKCERGDIVEMDKIKELFSDKLNGITIQLLHSHFYHFEIGKLIYNLESYFGNFVSTNIYITPNLKQGLKPHWDDIDAFILQIKGSKKWKLYSIKPKNKQFPIQQSYKDLNISNSDKYEFIMECILNPGDLLYFPRGIVHFAECVENENDDYSLHLTISTNQNYHYGNLIKCIMNKYLDDLIKNDINFRRNLPVNIIKNIGDDINMTDLGAMKCRNEFRDKMEELFMKLKKNVFGDGKSRISMMNECVDRMAVEFVSNRYPPVKFLKPDDFIVYGDDENKRYKEEVVEVEMKGKDDLIDFVEDNHKRDTIINGESEVRLVNPGWIRVIDIDEDIDVDGDDNKEEVDSFLDDESDEEEDVDLKGEDKEGKILVYSCVKNDHKTHLMAYDENMASEPMMGEKNDKQVFGALNKLYPKWIKVEKLKRKCDDRIDLKRICDLLFGLWADGIIETKKHK